MQNPTINEIVPLFTNLIYTNKIKANLNLEKDQKTDLFIYDNFVTNAKTVDVLPIIGNSICAILRMLHGKSITGFDLSFLKLITPEWRTK